jgi:PDZ domain-containing protein
LPDLPVPIFATPFEGFVDFGPIERGEGDHRPAANRGLVAGGLKDRVETRRVPERSESCDRRFAAERIGMSGGDVAESGEGVIGDRRALTARPGRRLDHSVVLVVEKFGHGEGDLGFLRIADRSRPTHRLFATASAHGRSRVPESPEQFGGGQIPDSVEGADGCRPRAGIGAAEQRPGERGVTGMAGEGGGPAGRNRFRGGSGHCAVSACPWGPGCISNENRTRSIRSSSHRNLSVRIVAAPTVAGFTPDPPGVHVTDEQPIKPDHGPVEARPRLWSRRARWLTAISLATLIVLVTLGVSVRLPSYTISPGMSRATEPLIAVDGAATYDSGGAVDFLTVSLRQTTPLEVFAAWLNPSIDVKSEKEIRGDQTPSENQKLNLQMMSESKDAAQYVALSRLGYDIGINGSGAVVASVSDGSPASGALRPGDVITMVDQVPVDLSSDLVRTIAANTPGTVVVLEVTPVGDGPTREVPVTLAARPDDAARAYLGVSTFTKDLSFDYPIQVRIDSGQVGGPSAGLAFTLGILDVLTPESISGGRKIATTGTMSLDGSVGPVGGVHQKVITARRVGVELMLVPSSEIDEARLYAGGMRVEPVDTIDDALAILATIGGGDSVLPARGTGVPVT